MNRESRSIALCAPQNCIIGFLARAKRRPRFAIVHSHSPVTPAWMSANHWSSQLNCLVVLSLDRARTDATSGQHHLTRHSCRLWLHWACFDQRKRQQEGGAIGWHTVERRPAGYTGSWTPRADWKISQGPSFHSRTYADPIRYSLESLQLLRAPRTEITLSRVTSLQIPFRESWVFLDMKSQQLAMSQLKK